MAFINENNIDELIQAQTLIWNNTFQFIKSMSLKLAVQLSIPDIINHHGQPMTLSELALALQIHPTKTQHLYRLMRVLIHSGFFKLQNINTSNNKSTEKGYILTTPSHLLLKDSPLNISHFVTLVLHPALTEPYNHLTSFLQNDDQTPFFTAFGESLWSYAEHEDIFSRVSFQSNEMDCLLIGKAVIIKCRKVFDGLDTLIDVGGGTGTMAKVISQAFPNLNCTVLDLPIVVSGLQGCNNLSFVSGDMFDTIPPADAILLKWVLHDWSDEECIKILKNCKEAIMANGKRGNKIIIIDMVVGINQSSDDNLTEVQLFFDIGAMTTITGKERTEKEWAELFVNGGFSNYKIYPVLGPRALIEVFP